MKRIKVVGLCLTAMFVFAVAATASASAHEYIIKEGTLPAKVIGSSGASKLEGTILKEKVTIECSADTLSGEIKEVNKSSGEITFSGCKVNGQPTCEVPNIKFKVKDELSGPTPGVEDTFLPTEAESTFVKIKIEVCALKGTYPVKGKQICKLPSGEVFAVKHTIECLPSGSELTLGSEAAKFTGTETVELESKKEWRAI